jgi:hypothetical protein
MMQQQKERGTRWERRIGESRVNEQRGTQVSGKFLTRSISGVDEATSNM